MRLLALTLLFAMFPLAASADCIASSMNVLGVVQLGDVITTSGPVTRSFPGGFLSQNNKAGCGLPGAAPCQYVEGDPLASRSGCVKSLATDFTCAAVLNVGVREIEELATRHNVTAHKDVCFLNYIAAAFYAIIVLPNNLHAVYDIQRNGAYVKNPALHVNFKVRF